MLLLWLRYSTYDLESAFYSHLVSSFISSILKNNIFLVIFKHKKWLLHSKKNFKSLSIFHCPSYLVHSKFLSLFDQNLGWCVTWLKNESVSSYFGQKEYSELKVICQCWKERNKKKFCKFTTTFSAEKKLKISCLVLLQQLQKKEAKRRSHFSSVPVVVFSSFDCSTARLFCISFLGTTCQL